MGIFSITIVKFELKVFLSIFGQIGRLSRMMKKSLHFFALSFFLISFLIPIISGAQVASFTASPSSGCAPLNVTFTNTSTGTTGATIYSWNFGNTNISSSPSNTVGSIYPNPGTYTVTLTVSNGTPSTFTSTITVFVSPVASFTISTMPSCPGQTVTFTDNSTPGSAALSSWLWDFGDGNGQTGAASVVTNAFVLADTFPVKIIVTDANGCPSAPFTLPVIISPAPTASFTASPISACSPPLTVNFTNTSTTYGTATYAWNFGDGNASTLVSPSNTYIVPGFSTVSLTVVQGACSDTEVKNNYIGIQNVIADFSVNDPALCVGQIATFTDQSLPLSNFQSWDFGDGSTSTLTNPTHIYALAGTYTVTLIEGTASCTDTIIKTNYITVSPSPVVAFSANQLLSCSFPVVITFSNTTTSGISYTWDFGDGSPNYVTASLANFNHTFTAPGKDTIKLTATSANTCQSVLSKPDYILISDPITDFDGNPTNGCVPLLVNFTSLSTSTYDPIVNYSWSFGDGSPIVSGAFPTTTNTYNTLGLFTVKLIITTASGCKDSLTKTNYISTGIKPIANFSVVDSTVCYGTNAEFNDLSIGSDSAFWQFDVNQGTFSTPPGTVFPYLPVVTNLFPDTGTFFVALLAYSNGCADTLQLDDIVRILPPKPIFTYQLSCSNYYKVSFTDASLGADSIVWDFGDGTFNYSNDTAPIHTYLTRGPKTVTLTAYNFLTGCSSSVPQSFTIAEPIAQFTATPLLGCYPLDVAFTNASTDDFSTDWYFGDGSPVLSYISPTPAFVHTYMLPKLDTAQLVITDVNGCQDTATTVITVYGPIPDFIAPVTTNCAPFLVTLNDASVSDSTLMQWTWNFGDGTAGQTVTVPTINHTYITPGAYTVTMKVTDKNGCVDSTLKAQYIIPTFPYPAIVADTFACRNEVILFSSFGTVAVLPATYNWDFGDGTSSSIPLVATHSYTSDNLYTVTLTITDANGCDSSVQHQIRIHHPTSAFTDSVLLIGCGVTNMQYTDHSTGLFITTWQWNFGDGASATQQNPMHAYTVPGTYNVSLITTNSFGCSDTLVKSVTVPGPSGTFSYTPSTGCPPLTVTFTAVSATAISYTWDFGDGTVVTTPTPIVQYTYPTDIIATPALLLGSTLPDGSFCQVAAPYAGQIIVVTVIPSVFINSNVSSGCVPLTVNFTDASIVPPTIPGDTITTWNWDFGDGGTSTEQNPVHVYSTAGSYGVTLSIITLGGCDGNNTISPTPITAHPLPIAAFSLNSTTLNLPYDALICTNQSVGAITYNWNLGDGTTTTTENPQHHYTSVGIFQIQLIATTQYSCTDTAISTIITDAEVVFPNAFTPNPNSGHGGDYTLYSLDNDIFFPYTAGVVDFRFSIFNRWGEKVFESLDISKGWDGYYHGKVCEQGVYVWRAYIRLNNGKEFDKNGDVTLLR